MAQTTVTATITDAGGNPASSGTVTFKLSPNSAGLAYRVAGTDVIAPQQVIGGIDSSGHLLNSDLSGPCLVWGNPAILPANTMYTVEIAPNNIVTSEINSVLIFGPTYDLSNIQFAPVTDMVPQQTTIRPSPVETNLVPAAGHVFNIGSQQLPYANVFADEFTLTGGATLGGTNDVQASFPFATVTVLNAGTTTLSTIFSDRAMTVPQANPFSADGKGFWSFYAAAGYYDVQFSGDGISVPYKITDFEIPALTVSDLFGPAVVSPCNFTGTDVGQKITNAMNALPSTGGTVDCRCFTGAQTITSQILVTKSNVTLLFGAAVFTCSGVAFRQSPPFTAAMIQVNGASNVWFIGIPGQTVFRLAGGSPGEQCNVFTWVNGTNSNFNSLMVGGGVRYIEMDGNKASITSQPDDTFQSGVQIIATWQSQNQDCRITVDNCSIHDFNHDGIVTYGGLGRQSDNTSSAGGCRFTNNVIFNNGKNDGTGTGYGILLQSGSSRNFVSRNTLYNNLRNGITAWAVSDGAGTPYLMLDNQITNNILYSNTASGIVLVEEDDFGSINGSTQTGCIIANNQSFNNTQHGIVLAAVSSHAAVIQNFVIANNVCYGNQLEGIYLSSNASDTVKQGIVLGNESFNNTQYGIITSPNVFDILIANNVALNNPSGNIQDGGTRTRIFGNVIDTSSNIFSVNGPLTSGGAATIGGTLTSQGVVLSSGASIQLNQVPTRSWTIFPGSGNLNVTSGDGNGILNIPLSGGLQLAGPVTNTNDVFGNRPGFGTRAPGQPAALPVQPGMVMCFTDSTTAAWGTTISGGGTNIVLGWYNSGTGVWTVIGH